VVANQVFWGLVVEFNHFSYGLLPCIVISIIILKTWS
jgi:hypothetical protein